MPKERENISDAGLRIDSVIPGSIADELEVVAGDLLLAVNGHHLRDLIDYTYYAASEEELLLEIEKPNGELWELEVERSEGEQIGLIFPAPEPAICGNNCIFCFVHQLPKGLRKQLYVKDEDYRLSFLNGNYVTLANLNNSDIERITIQRLSPLYISVHATNPQLREHLLGKSKIPHILEQLQKLAAVRIVMHTQIVLCPGLNDKDELLRTVNDLADLFPAVESLAIVPLGLTNHRHKLPGLNPVDSSYAIEFVKVWRPLSKALNLKLGQPFLQLADEFFLKAGMPFPAINEYGDFPQIENGVGLVPLFLREASQVIRHAKVIGGFRATVITGVSSCDFVSEFVLKLGEKCCLDLVPLSVENRLFGASVTVTGLLSGDDIASALEGHEIGAVLLVPEVMLKEGEDVFIDSLSIEGLEQKIGCPVLPFDSTPRGFYRALKLVQKRFRNT